MKNPAIGYYENGQKSYEEYWKGYNLHRLDGPAAQYWRRNGELSCAIYYINGEEIECSSDQEFEKIVKLLIFK